MNRPLIHLGINKLEGIFARNPMDSQMLIKLAWELQHRKTLRARSLLRRIESVMYEGDGFSPALRSISESRHLRSVGINQSEEKRSGDKLDTKFLKQLSYDEFRYRGFNERNSSGNKENTLPESGQSPQAAISASVMAASGYVEQPMILPAMSDIEKDFSGIIADFEPTSCQSEHFKDEGNVSQKPLSMEMVAGAIGKLRGGSLSLAGVPELSDLVPDEIFRVLRMCSGWDGVEEMRRQLVQQASPASTAAMPPEKQLRLQAQAEIVNYVYLSFWKIRLQQEADSTIDAMMLAAIASGAFITSN